MLFAIDEKGQQITAVEAVKGENYFCPVCGSKLTYKAGSVKVAHFSHHQIIDCIRYFYKKESIEHLKMKHDLYLLLSPYLKVAMEYYLADIEQIPDLLVNHKIALEIQLSRISPELIAERTKGYRSIGMDVIWILQEGDIKIAGEYVVPSHFHLSTMLRGRLVTYDERSSLFYHYHLKHHIGGGRWTFDKHVVTIFECLLLQPYIERENHTLSILEIEKIVKREKQARSVLNPTLSFLYQLRLDVRKLPRYMRVVTTAERYILNSPIEWKLYLQYHLLHKSLNIEQFTEFIELRVLSEIPDKAVIIQQLLNDYILLYNSQ